MMISVLDLLDVFIESHRQRQCPSAADILSGLQTRGIENLTVQKVTATLIYWWNRGLITRAWHGGHRKFYYAIQAWFDEVELGAEDLETT